MEGGVERRRKNERKQKRVGNDEDRAKNVEKRDEKTQDKKKEAKGKMAITRNI